MTLESRKIFFVPNNLLLIFCYKVEYCDYFGIEFGGGNIIIYFPYYIIVHYFYLIKHTNYISQNNKYLINTYNNQVLTNIFNFLSTSKFPSKETTSVWGNYKAFHLSNIYWPLIQSIALWKNLVLKKLIIIIFCDHVLVRKRWCLITQYFLNIYDVQLSSHFI